MKLGTFYIWIYEYRFGKFKEIERQIGGFLSIGEQTPFLLLKHEFALRVLPHIHEAISATDRLPSGLSVYGAHNSESILSLKQTADALKTYVPPPAQHMGKAKYGARYPSNPREKWLC